MNNIHPGHRQAWTTGTCTAIPNRDYNPGGASAQVLIGASHYYMDQAACCRACGSTDGCAAAIFRLDTPCQPFAQLCRGHCTFRTAEDLLQPVNATDNSTACIPDGLQQTGTITINNATVPGDLVTDLQNAGIAEDPLTDTNFKNTTFWNGKLWTYTKYFAWPPAPAPTSAAATSTATAGAAAAAGGEVLLVFEGVKMGASISLNGHVLGNITDQFLRVSYPVASFLHADDNELKVVFDRNIGTHARFMACSGGWVRAIFCYSLHRNSQNILVGRPIFN